MLLTDIFCMIYYVTLYFPLTVAFGQAVYCKRTFLHAQSFSISADAPLTNESIVTSKIENEHVASVLFQRTAKGKKKNERERKEAGKR